MSYNPFKINGRTSISFSGGRTSAYLLWRVLEANGGLPENTRVVFANTGKEMPETLDFVRDCGEAWGVQIDWVEWREGGAGFELVNHATASREGEPFAALVRMRKYLPNPITRFCTSELKIRAMGRFLKGLGWRDGNGWDTLIGIRADEPRRVAKIRARGRSTECAQETMVMPLADAGIGAAVVGEFWRRQGFDLKLRNDGGRTLYGNCDLCFLKPLDARMAMIRENPSRAVWWAAQEAAIDTSMGLGARFRKDEPGYAAMAAAVEAQQDFFGDSEAIECFCGD